jgi:predicted amino acid-binding ACT domain protein
MSGGQQGPGVIQRLSSLLNPNQIIDIRQGMLRFSFSLYIYIYICSSAEQRATQRDLSSPGL